ncbi:MAG: hypothetical protein AAFQ80_13740 [Cyanobacteria bacterium J06621_8]
MPYFYLALLSFSLFSLTNPAIAQESPQEDDNQYPAEFVRDYNRECIQTSIAEGLGEADAKQLCSCTIDEFEQQYDLEEFQELTAASVTDQEAETALIEVGEFCFEQILFEQ